MRLSSHVAYCSSDMGTSFLILVKAGRKLLLRVKHRCIQSNLKDTKVS